MAIARSRTLLRVVSDSHPHVINCLKLKPEICAWSCTTPISRYLLNAKFSSSTQARQQISAKTEVNGTNIHYTRVGHGSHVVLLLPGALGCAQTDFKPQLEGLSRQKYTVLCFDPRGYGQSRPPDRDWPLDFYQRDAEDAVTFMKNLDFPRYSVLGWSDGGITAMVMAGANPGVFRKLLVWGANAYLTAEELELYEKIGNVDNWSPRMKQPFFEVYGEDYFRTQWKKWILAMREISKQRKGDLCIGSLSNIKCKTLIVSGLKDPLVAPEHAPFLNKHIAKSRLVSWPEGKHNLHLRYNEEFNALAEEFLDEAD